MTKSKHSTFPKEILVKLEVDGDTEFLVVGEPQDLAEAGVRVTAARYALVGTGRVHGYADYVEDGAEADETA